MKMRQSIRLAVIESNSPWCDLESACAYTGFSKSTILRLRNDGTLKEYFVPGVIHPRYRKTDLDQLFVEGGAPARRRGRKSGPVFPPPLPDEIKNDVPVTTNVVNEPVRLARKRLIP